MFDIWKEIAIVYETKGNLLIPTNLSSFLHNEFGLNEIIYNFL